MGVFWLQLVSVFLLSCVKFVFGGVPLALLYGFSFFETVTVTCLGGFLGSTFFVYTSDKLIAYFKKRKALKDEKNKSQAPSKKFTRTNKIIVTAKKRFGLLGIAVLTPALLSIPIGCFLAVRYFKDKQRVLMYMFGSILFWSVAISSFKLFF